MAETISKWGALAASVLSASSEFDSLADDGNAAGSAYDNETNRYLYGDYELNFDAATAPSGHVSLYLVQSLDGTNYAYGDDSIDPSSGDLKCTFELREATGPQRIIESFVVLPNTQFKHVFVNESGVTCASGMAYFRPYNISGS